MSKTAQKAPQTPQKAPGDLIQALYSQIISDLEKTTWKIRVQKALERAYHEGFIAFNALSSTPSSPALPSPPSSQQEPKKKAQQLQKAQLTYAAAASPAGSKKPAQITKLPPRQPAALITQKSVAIQPSAGIRALEPKQAIAKLTALGVKGAKGLRTF
jgi:hypothetical protein